LTPQAEGVLKQMIQEKKLDMVSNRQLSLYANVGVDLTAELTRRLNEVK
jgi:outer membrane protein